MPYLTPDEIPEGTVCRPLFIPAGTDWLAIVSGALTELAKTWNWEAYGSVTVEEAVDVINLMISRYYDELCATCLQPGGDPVVSLDEFGSWRMLEGEVWVAPSGDYALPLAAPRTELTDEEKRCLASANAVNVLKETYEEVVDLAATVINLAEFILELATFIGAFFAPGLGLLARAAMPLIAVIVGEIFTTAEFITADAWTAEFDDELLCILFLRSSVGEDDRVSFDFDLVVNAITNELAFDVDLTLFSQRLALQVGYMLQIIGAEGLNIAGGTTAVTSADCDECAGTWCYWIDLTTMAGDFVPGGAGVTWVTGEGWESWNLGGNNCENLWGNYPLGMDVSVTSATAIFNRDAAIGGGNVSLVFRLNRDGSQQAVFSQVPGPTGNPLCIEIDDEVTIDSMYVDVNSGIACGVSYLRGFVLRGNGANPFGADNCEFAPCG